jgi:hypothetical protein
MIPADLQKKESDVIFRVPYRAQSEGREWEVLINVLLGRQSQHDPLMALRLLFCMVELWSEQRRVAEAARVSEGQVRIDPIIRRYFDKPDHNTSC